MKVKDFIFKDGFINIFYVFFENWLKDIDFNEKRSFCVFVFVVFFGGRIFIIDFLSQLISFFYKRICIEYDVFLKELSDKEKQKLKMENLIKNNNCCLESCLY